MLTNANACRAATLSILQRSRALKSRSYEIRYNLTVSFHEIKRSLMKALGLEIGKIRYIRPGHSMKGRKCSLEDDNDVAEMYSTVYRQASYCLRCYLLLGHSTSSFHWYRIQVSEGWQEKGSMKVMVVDLSS